MLGTRQAVLKTSQISPVPKMFAQTMSRTMPKMRLERMHSATVLAERTGPPHRGFSESDGGT